jgi:flagellar motor switch protein FliM
MGKPHFKVYPGTMGKNLAVQVEEIISKDVEEDE